MSHLHKQFRDAVIARLMGLATTGANVFEDTGIALPEERLPGLLVDADSETAEELTMQLPVLQERRLSLGISCCAKPVSGVNDLVDQMSLEVELAMATGFTVAGHLFRPVYVAMDRHRQIADKAAGVKRLEYHITYTSAANAPDTLS